MVFDEMSQFAEIGCVFSDSWEGARKPSWGRSLAPRTVDVASATNLSGAWVREEGIAKPLTWHTPHTPRPGFLCLAS